MKGTTNVYISPYSGLTVDNYEKAEQVSRFLFGDIYPAEYIKVGTAEISITFDPRSDVVKNKVEALRKELCEVRAEAQVKAKGIEEQIQNLLAITNEVSS